MGGVVREAEKEEKRVEGGAEEAVHGRWMRRRGELEVSS